MRISVDLVANTGSFVTDFRRAQKQAEATAKGIETAFSNLGQKIVGFLAVREVLQFTSATIDSIANLQDLAEKTGDTAREFATLKLASDLSGVSLDTVAAASVKLTATLAKQDEESTGAAQAIKALGLNFDEFKKLQPVEQIDAVAKALAGFEDGASKTAVSVALFGKSGSELIPFLNDLSDQTERTTGLTSEQIKQADELTKSYARLLSQTTSLAQEFGTSLVDVMSDTRDVVDDVILSSIALRDETGKLVLQDGFKQFAQNVVIAAAIAGEAIIGVIKLISALGDSFNTQINNLKILGQGSQALFYFGLDKSENDQFRALLQERNRLVQKENEAYLDLWNYNGTAVSDALKKQFADVKTQVATFDPLAGINRVLNPQFSLDRQIPLRAGPLVQDAPVGKPKIDFDPNAAADALARQKKATADAAAELKKYEDSVKSAQKTLGDLAMNLEMQVMTFGQGEEAVLNYRLSVGDLSDEVKLAGANGAELVERIKKRAAALRTLTAAQDASNEARARARDLEDLQRNYTRQIQAVTESPAVQRFNQGAQSIEDDARSQRRQAEDRFKMSGNQQAYDNEVASIEKFAGKARTEWKNYYAEIERLSMDFGASFEAGIEKWLDKLGKVGGALAGDVTSAIDGATAATSRLAAETLLWGGGGVEAAKAIARTLITDVVTGFIQAGIKAALFHTLNKTGIATTSAVSAAAQTSNAAVATATNTTIIATAAPAAALTSIASFGGSAAAAAIAIGLVAGAIGALIGGAFADGGLVEGPGSGRSDSILAKVSNGEYVIPANIVSALGVDYFDSLLAGKMPAFADGGLVELAPQFNGDSLPTLGSSNVAQMVNSEKKTPVNVQVMVVDSMEAARQLLGSQEGQRFILEAARKNPASFRSAIQG